MLTSHNATSPIGYVSKVALPAVTSYDTVQQVLVQQYLRGFTFYLRANKNLMGLGGAAVLFVRYQKAKMAGTKAPAVVGLEKL